MQVQEGGGAQFQPELHWCAKPYSRMTGQRFKDRQSPPHPVGKGERRPPEDKTPDCVAAKISLAILDGQCATKRVARCFGQV